MISTASSIELNWSVKHRRIQWGLVAFLTVFGVFALLVATLAPDDVSESPWLRIGCGVAALLAFIGAANFVHEARLATRRLVLNEHGLQVFQGTTAITRFAWYDIKYLTTKFTSGETVRFTFFGLDPQHKLFTFSTEGIEQASHEVLRMIWGHLRELITKQSESDITDPTKLKFAGISKVVDLHSNLLTIEMPKGKKTPLHLDDIVDVSILGTMNTQLRIHHRRGILELPMAMPCSAILLTWLWTRKELDGRVLPPPREGAKEEHTRLSRCLQRKSFARFLGTIVLVLGGFYTWRGMNDIHPPSEIQSRGIAASATYLEQAGPEKIKLTFIAQGGEKVNITQRVEPLFFDNHKLGATFELLYLPTNKQVVWFKHCWGQSENAIIYLGALLAVLFLAGLSAILWGRAGTDKLSQRLAELTDIPPPANHGGPPQLPQIHPPPLPPALPSSAASVTEDKVRPAETPMAQGKVCHACKHPFHGAYYTWQQMVYCEPCRNIMLEKPPTRTGMSTFMKAGCLGYFAALAAAAVWATVTILTGYALGIIAIVVGLIVGAIVRKCSGGGRRYQFLALFLTVTALAYATVPMFICEVMKNPEMRAEFTSAFEKGKTPPIQNDQVEPLPADNKNENVPAEATTNNTPIASQQLELPAKPVEILVAVLALVLAVVVGPYVLYALTFVGNPMSFLFLGIALWEAWKLAAVRAPEFAGPFTSDDPQNISFDRFEPA